MDGLCSREEMDGRCGTFLSWIGRSSLDEGGKGIGCCSFIGSGATSRRHVPLWVSNVASNFMCLLLSAFPRSFQHGKVKSDMILS